MNNDSLQTWFLGERKKLALTVEQIPMADARDWKVVTEDGKPHHIGNASGSFHRGIFLRSFEPARGTDIERFMIAPIVSFGDKREYGVALLAKHAGRYLVQAKAEPGNGTQDHVLLTTTLQASYGNIADQLSGEVPFAELYKDEKCVRYMIPQDGAQMYMKVNQVCTLELEAIPDSIPEHFTWAMKEEILSLAREGTVSEHILQCLGLETLLV